MLSTQLVPGAESFCLGLAAFDPACILMPLVEAYLPSAIMELGVKNHMVRLLGPNSTITLWLGPSSTTTLWLDPLGCETKSKHPQAALARGHPLHCAERQQAFVRSLELLAVATNWGPERPPKQMDPTKHGFWYPPSIGPWSQEVRSLSLCCRLSPYKLLALFFGLIGSVP